MFNIFDNCKLLFFFFITVVIVLPLNIHFAHSTSLLKYAQAPLYNITIYLCTYYVLAYILLYIMESEHIFYNYYCIASKHNNNIVLLGIIIL